MSAVIGQDVALSKVEKVPSDLSVYAHDFELLIKAAEWL